MSGMPSEFVKRSAVAEVLGLHQAEVDRMIEEDGLPAIKLPGLKYTKIRIHLPDLHRWLLIGCRNSNPRLRDYEAFRAAFQRKKGRGKSANQQEDEQPVGKQEKPSRYHAKCPCEECGTTERWTKTGTCVACGYQKRRKRYAEDPEFAAKEKNRVKEWQCKKYAESPEWVEKHNAVQRERHHANNFMRNFKSAVLLKGALGDEKTNNNNND